GARARRDKNEIKARRNVRLAQPIALTVQRPEPIPLDGSAVFPRDGEAEPRIVPFIWRGIDDQPIVAGGSPGIVDAAKVGGPPQVLVGAEAGHGTSERSPRRLGSRQTSHSHGGPVRGFCGFNFANSSINSRQRSSVALGTTTWASM